MGCITPITVHKKTSNMSIPVPCGKCPECVARRTSSWSFRLMQEEKRSSSAYFVTLTYDTESVPLTRGGFMDLSKCHVQKFIKALRKRQPAGSLPLKYFLVGEYGGRSRRPHYHIILFNAGLSSLIGASYETQVKHGTIELDGQIPFRNSSWPFGHITVGTVSGASVGYTMKYIAKPWRPMHRNDDRTPVFSLMSKGIGSNYITPQMVQWHLHDPIDRMYCVLLDGKKVSMPRYYKDKIFGVDNDLRKKQSVVHKKRFLEAEGERQTKYGDQYSRDMAENHLGQFRKMQLNANNGETI